jgi:hypothetical protein
MEVFYRTGKFKKTAEFINFHLWKKMLITYLPLPHYVVFALYNSVLIDNQYQTRLKSVNMDKAVCNISDKEKSFITLPFSDS